MFEYKVQKWHESAWPLACAPGGRQAHALLLTGRTGIGKGQFGMALAARFLCEAPPAIGACGQCDSCRWLAGENHPDFRVLIPAAEAEGEEAGEGEKKKGSRQITIDQVRALEEFVYVGAHRGGARVVLIEPAEAMNAPAANALLKILEEPPASVYFILISSTWRRLLPTLRSRCRVVKLPGPSAQAVREWLAGQGDERMAELLPLAGGAPLRAVEEVRRGHGPALRSLLGELASPGSDPLALAGRWESLLQGKNDSGLSMETLVGVLQKWVFDLAQLKAAGRARYAGKWAEGARALAVRASMAALIRCYNDLIKMRALANHPLNPRLFLEDMAERYLRAVAVRP